MSNTDLEIQNKATSIFRAHLLFHIRLRFGREAQHIKFYRYLNEQYAIILKEQ